MFDRSAIQEVTPTGKCLMTQTSLVGRGGRGEGESYDTKMNHLDSIFNFLPLKSPVGGLELNVKQPQRADWPGEETSGGRATFSKLQRHPIFLRTFEG